MPGQRGRGAQAQARPAPVHEFGRRAHHPFEGLVGRRRQRDCAVVGPVSGRGGQVGSQPQERAVLRIGQDQQQAQRLPAAQRAPQRAQVNGHVAPEEGHPARVGARGGGALQVQGSAAAATQRGPSQRPQAHVGHQQRGGWPGGGAKGVREVERQALRPAPTAPPGEQPRVPLRGPGRPQQGLACPREPRPAEQQVDLLAGGPAADASEEKVGPSQALRHAPQQPGREPRAAAPQPASDSLGRAQVARTAHAARGAPTQEVGPAQRHVRPPPAGPRRSRHGWGPRPWCDARAGPCGEPWSEYVSTPPPGGRRGVTARAGAVR